MEVGHDVEPRRAGNLQLTDGEVLLGPAEEVIELLRYAREIGLIAMLMTHGHGFRRNPGLLERLMVGGGLEEVSLHIDATERGRRGGAYKNAEREADLMALREEFAGLVRQARNATGKTLRVATAVTVTPRNPGEVSDIARWAGVTFRSDRPGAALARLAGMAARAPAFFAATLPR